jgi:hypothetical protein
VGGNATPIVVVTGVVGLWRDWHAEASDLRVCFARKVLMLREPSFGEPSGGGS